MNELSCLFEFNLVSTAPIELSQCCQPLAASKAKNIYWWLYLAFYYSPNGRKIRVMSRPIPTLNIAL